MQLDFDKFLVIYVDMMKAVLLDNLLDKSMVIYVDTKTDFLSLIHI